MVAFIDEARARIVGIFTRPGAQKVIVERRTARRTAVGRRPFHRLHDVWDGPQVLLDDGGTHGGVAVLGALAHLFRAGLRQIRIPHRTFQQAFDQAGTRTATGRGLGATAHLVEGVGTTGDGADNLTLGHAVAAAHFRVVGPCCNGARRVLAGQCIGDGLAEDQGVADIGDALGLLDQVEIPAAVGRFTEQDGADQLVVFDDDALVDAAARVAEDDVFATFAAGELTGRVEVDA